MFFTDLDRTLIFSKRFSIKERDRLVAVEKKEDREISYMTKRAVSLLSEYRKIGEFIPVTARSLEQAMRIDFIKGQLPEWMVTENGRAIYHHGNRFHEWDTLFVEKMKNIHEKILVAQEKFHQIFVDELGCEIFSPNDEMMIAKIDHLSEEQKNELGERLGFFNEYDCVIHFHPRKIYLMPNIISKGEAVRYLIEKLSPEITISAGDTDMDESMFHETQHHIVPLHHTIVNRGYITTKNEGFVSGEEILEYVIKKIKKK